MMALSFIEHGHEAYILFEKDFSVTNQEEARLKLYSFEGSFCDDGFYLQDFQLKDSSYHVISGNDTIHMRVDPPYDSRYQRYLWMLDFLSDQTGVNIANSVKGIMFNNEKLVAYKEKNASVDSFIGSSLDQFNSFVEKVKKAGTKSLILKPLDLYSGIGVEKVSIEQGLEQKFLSKVKEFAGAIVAQPFIENVYEGELRSIFFDGKEVGTIIKYPSDGGFLANIAQGAKYEKKELSPQMKQECTKVAKKLYQEGVRMAAFDILGDTINEVNVTCPGLLVEVSYATKTNLALEYAKLFN